MSEAFPAIDFHHYHQHELPRLLAEGRGRLAAKGGLAGVGSLAFQLPEGDAYTYVPRDGGVEVLAGQAQARTVIEISREDWQGLVHDLESAPGLLYAGRASCPRGKAMRFVLWEPGLRAMYAGHPPLSPAPPICAIGAAPPSMSSVRSVWRPAMPASPLTSPKRWPTSCAPRASCS